MLSRGCLSTGGAGAWPLQNHRRRRRAAVPHRRILKDHPGHGAAPRAYRPSNKAFARVRRDSHPSMPQCRRARRSWGRPRNRSNRTSGASLRPVQGCVGERPPRRQDSSPPLSRSGRTRPLPAPQPTCSCNTPPHSLLRRYAQSCFQSDSLKRRGHGGFPAYSSSTAGRSVTSSTGVWGEKKTARAGA